MKRLITLVLVTALALGGLWLGGTLAFDAVALRDLGPSLDDAVEDADFPLYGWRVVDRSFGLNTPSVTIELEHPSLTGALLSAFTSSDGEPSRTYSNVTVDLRREGLDFEPIRATGANPVVVTAMNVHLELERSRDD